MAYERNGLGVTKRQRERIVAALHRDHLQLPVIPYVFPWYELLLLGKLTIQTANGKFAVKTGLWPRKHRGWTLFYHSKSRVADLIAERHNINPRDHKLGVLLGVAWLEDSRPLTPEERFELALKFNNYTERRYCKLMQSHYGFDVRNMNAEDRLDCVPTPYDWHAMPYPVGNFYRPETLKRFQKPIPIKYPPGAVTGTNLAVIPEIEKALRRVGVTL